MLNSQPTVLQRLAHAWNLWTSMTFAHHAFSGGVPGLLASLPKSISASRHSSAGKNQHAQLLPGGADANYITFPKGIRMPCVKLWKDTKKRAPHRIITRVEDPSGLRTLRVGGLPPPKPLRVGVLPPPKPKHPGPLRVGGLPPPKPSTRVEDPSGLRTPPGWGAAAPETLPGWGAAAPQTQTPRTPPGWGAVERGKQAFPTKPVH